MIPSAADLAWITARWAKWEAIARYEMILNDSAIDYHARHAARCTDALLAGLPRATIIRDSIDNPVPSDIQFHKHFDRAIERRRARMGRAAGKRRASYATAVHLEET